MLTFYHPIDSKYSSNSFPLIVYHVRTINGCGKDVGRNEELTRKDDSMTKDVKHLKNKKNER